MFPPRLRCSITRHDSCWNTCTKLPFIKILVLYPSPRLFNQTRMKKIKNGVNNLLINKYEARCKVSFWWGHSLLRWRVLWRSRQLQGCVVWNLIVVFVSIMTFCSWVDVKVLLHMSSAFHVSSVSNDSFVKLTQMLGLNTDLCFLITCCPHNRVCGAGDSNTQSYCLIHTNSNIQDWWWAFKTAS